MSNYYKREVTVAPFDFNLLPRSDTFIIKNEEFGNFSLSLPQPINFHAIPSSIVYTSSQVQGREIKEEFELIRPKTAVNIVRPVENLKPIITETNKSKPKRNDCKGAILASILIVILIIIIIIVILTKNNNVSTTLTNNTTSTTLASLSTLTVVTTSSTANGTFYTIKSTAQTTITSFNITKATNSSIFTDTSITSTTLATISTTLSTTTTTLTITTTTTKSTILTTLTTTLTTKNYITVALYGQCGGVSYSGSQTCITGTYCYAESIYFSQCLFTCPTGWICPTDITTATTSLPQVALYGQCGGVNYSGSTNCVYGLTCCKQSIWYSQCSFSC